MEWILNELAVSGFEGGLGPVAGLQLSEDVRHVILYGAFGKEECTGDFAIAGALRNEAKYLDFTFSPNKRNTISTLVDS